MAASDIRAGRAFVELGLDNKKFIRGLRQASQKLKDFGSGVAKMGAGIAASGAAITGSLLVAVRSFAAAGDELDKMSLRTGVAAGALAELSFAAEQSGSNLGAVENAIRRTQKTISDANRGLSTAVDAFDMLGLSVADLNSMSPEDQFQAIAESIAGIEDHTKRAGAAMMVFGSRQGTALLPMLENIRELREEARDLGLTPSDESIKKAADLTDAFNRIRRAVGAVVYEIGFSLSDIVLKAAGVIKTIVSATIRWTKENHGLVQVLFAVGAGLSAAGAAIMAIGGSIFFAGLALSGFATLISAVGSAVGLLVSPIGLTTVALAAGVTAWARYTASGQDAVKRLTGGLSSLVGIAKNTFSGIQDAIAGGDLSLAGNIAMAGLRVAFLKGMEGISNIFGGFLAKFGGQIMGGDFVGAFNTALLQMANNMAWQAQVIVEIFTRAAQAVIDAWQGAVTGIAKMMIDVASSDGPAGVVMRKIIGVDRMSAEDAIGAKQIITDNVGAKADIGRGLVNDLSERINSGIRDNVRDPVAHHMSTGADANSAALQAAQDDLDKLREEARQAREASRQQTRERTAGLSSELEDVGGESMRQQVVGSFSAAALSAMGQTSNPMERAAKGIDKLNAKFEELRKIDERLLQEVRNGGTFA